tara:strand:+ start:4013 stop:5377 length:1365 start_codon:yes stop_codon:yes gene_type:complete
MNSNTDTFLSDYEAVYPGLPGSGVKWLDSIRRCGMEEFRAQGLPTGRTEDWKYTRLRSLEDTIFRPATLEDGEVDVNQLPTLFSGDSMVPRIVFVNGCLKTEFSCMDNLPDGVTVDSLRGAMDRDPEWFASHLGQVGCIDGNPLVALNTAMMNSGAVVRVHKDTAVEKPIEMIFVAGLTNGPVAYYPRNLIVMDEGADATFIQHHTGLGGGPYFVNSVTEIEVSGNARLRHYSVQNENVEATHLASIHVRVGCDATYEAFCMSTGGRLSRNESFVRLEGSGGHCGLNGAYMMRGKEHCDNTTLIEHMVPYTSCREVFKGVLDDESRSVFQGKITVHKDAQKTDGRMLSKTLLLSDRAEIDTKPELEIYADDVKCAHGATTGQLNTEALFYLRSRGIPDALARSLLVESFIAEAIEEISHLDVRAAMTGLVASQSSNRRCLGIEISEKSEGYKFE